MYCKNYIIRATVFLLCSLAYCSYKNAILPISRTLREQEKHKLAIKCIIKTSVILCYLCSCLKNYRLKNIIFNVAILLVIPNIFFKAWYKRLENGHH